jgi:hypothetical protein
MRDLGSGEKGPAFQETAPRQKRCELGKGTGGTGRISWFDSSDFWVRRRVRWIFTEKNGEALVIKKNQLGPAV